MTERVAILAPAGRDAMVMERLLGLAGIACVLMRAEDLVGGIASQHIDVGLITEEALPGLYAADLRSALEGQPPWSDFPFVALTGKGMLPSATATMVHALGHVTQLERPVQAGTLVRAVRSMLRARARQHDAKRYLDDRAAAESRLREFAATLERRVRDGARDLSATNDRLFAEMVSRIDAIDRMNQMQAQLVHVSRISAMGTMATTLAHELNQPLTAVMNYVRGSRRMLARLDSPIDGEILGALDAAVESAGHAGNVIQHLRDLVRTSDTNRAPTYLPRLINDALAIGLVGEAVHGITHSLTLDATATMVMVDPIQIQQVLINLLRNAAEAMHANGGGDIAIMSRRSAGETVEVSVSDSGPGIPAAILDSLFSPFQSTKSQGMGIGLSISRTIVEANGGTISGSNRDGGGAIFRFDLPLASTPAGPTIPET